MKQKLQIDYGYASNYYFSISLAMWSVPGLSFAQPFFNKASIEELFTSSPERLIILIIISCAAVITGIMGLYYATKNKYQSKVQL